MSRSLRVLRELPELRRESEVTRQQITHAMEQLARSQRPHRARSGAGGGWALARRRRRQRRREGSADDGAERTAGYYLIGPGRAALVAALAAGRSRPAAAPRSAAARHRARLALPIYSRASSAGTALLLAAVVHGLHLPAWTARRRSTLVALVLLAWPVSEAVIALVHRIAGRIDARADRCRGWTSPPAFPRAHRVLVVMPALLVSADVQRAAGAAAGTALAGQPRSGRRSSRC